MCKTKFLQMCSFSNILTSLLSFNLSFPLLFYVVSTAIPKVLRIFGIPNQIPDHDFKKIVTLDQERALPFVTFA